MTFKLNTFYLVEDYPKGYPRFSALIAADPSLHIYRRFANLRTRLLLLKQDRLSLLEKQLQEIDNQETNVLFLGKSRCDSNSERLRILSETDDALADYGMCFRHDCCRDLYLTLWTDALVERNSKILSYIPARPRDIRSLQNWINGTACLARDETTYLTNYNDLTHVTSPCDDGLAERLETWIEDKLVYISSVLRKVRISSFRT
jgi:hypothetical protein